MTKSYAKDILALWQSQSAIYNGALTSGMIENILTSAKSFDGKPLFSQADAIVITMALKLAGAKLD